jgi:hypothetical protein
VKDATTIIGLAAAFAVLGYLNIQDLHRFEERRIAVAEECVAKVMNLLPQASEQRDQVLGDLKTLRPNDAYELEQRLKELKQEMQQELRRIGVQECQKFLKMMETRPRAKELELERPIEPRQYPCSMNRTCI